MKFIFSKVAGLQACRRVASNFTNKLAPYRYFSRILLHERPPCFPHVLTQSPHQILKSPLPRGGGGGAMPPCSQHLWGTLMLGTSGYSQPGVVVLILPSLDDFLNAKDSRYQLILSDFIAYLRILHSDWMRDTTGHTKPKLDCLWGKDFSKY